MTARDRPAFGPRYRLLSELGRGGMGTVYLVHDQHRLQDVALKLLHRLPASREELEEIQSEYALLARLEHPGLARAYDFGYLAKRPYFTREYIAGESLAAAGMIEDVPELVRLAREIAEAIAFLHRSRLVHLDVKPSNILLAGESAPARAVLIDFGLCRRTPFRARDDAALPGTHLKGSLPYLAPEYFHGGRLGPWTDVYALGVTLYRLATGRFPRAPSNGRSLSNEAASPPPPSLVRPSLPADLDHLILKCLALDPTARFASADEVLASLEKAAGSRPASARPESTAALTVGRQAELDRAESYLSSVLRREGRPAALLVTALPGMGQTHFLREVKMHAEARGFACYLEQGYPRRPGPPGSLLRGLGAHLPKEERAIWGALLARLRRPGRSGLPPGASEGERRLRRAGEACRAAASLDQPLLLIADGLQHFDEVSIALVVDLVRFLADRQEARPPFGLILGCREEGPAARLISELSEQILESARGEAIALRPLGLEESLELYRSRRESRGPAAPASGRPALGLFQATQGSPREIVALAAESGEGPPPSRYRPRGRRTRSPALLSREKRRALLALRLFQRPATLGELCAAARVPPRRLPSLLEELRSADLAAEAEGAGGAPAWSPAAGADGALGDVSSAARRAAHGRIARLLLRARASGEGSLVEAVEHFRLAGQTASFVRQGTRAARYLKSTFQHRAALTLFGQIAGVLGPAHPLRLQIVFEMAELHARVGDLDQGIALLRDLLSRAGGRPPAVRRRVLLRLATLYSRRGEFQRADAHFSRGLREARSALTRAERLFFLNEHAAVKAFRGRYHDALRLCDEGLRQSRGSRTVRTQEVILNLHATRANVALRTFDYPEAVRWFEKALQVAEAIGAPASQAVILNNLGIVHSQCDRYAEAVRSFTEADRMCVKLDEGPSRASIHGNLAVLHAKTGDFEAMAHALLEGERLPPGERGRRQEFFLRHARGLALLYRGRYAEAQPHFEAAARLGAAMGDHHVVAFDEVYRAETLLFQARYAEAARELEKLAAPGSAIRVRRLALTRLALLAGLTGDREALGRAMLRRSEVPAERQIPFLDAWDGLFLAWALSISGDLERAREQLDPAESFFRSRGAAPALALALWVRAEGCFIHGDAAGASRHLEQAGALAGGLTSVLRPLLAARLLLTGSGGRPARDRAEDLLAQAGAELVGNPLPEWSLRLLALRALLSPDPRAILAEVEERREELARELPAEVRAGYLASFHWKAWTAGSEPVPAPQPARGKRQGKDRVPRPKASEPATRTTLLPGSAAARPGTDLVARSPAMRKLWLALDRLRGTDLPVLLLGETGSGKEHVARIIHQHSRRGKGPFRVVECGAIPPALLEAELFGARAGAYSGIHRDRPGLLAAAAGGTVLLDEIAEASLEVQAKLLRMISEGSVRPVGADREVRIDVRFLFSSTRDVAAEAREGRFRQDLLHRIQVMVLRVPPLRERQEDLPDLASWILREVSPARPPAIEPEALRKLRAHPWPGNVRQLKNLLSRLAIGDARRITERAVKQALSDPPTATLFPSQLLAGGELPALLGRLEREYLLYHYRRLGGDSGLLCKFLRLGPRQFYRRCERLKISLRAERQKMGPASLI